MAARWAGHTSDSDANSVSIQEHVCRAESPGQERIAACTELLRAVTVVNSNETALFVRACNSGWETTSLPHAPQPHLSHAPECLFMSGRLCVILSMAANPNPRPLSHKQNGDAAQPGATMRSGQRRRPPVESGSGNGSGDGAGVDMEYEAEFVSGVMVRHDPSHLRLAALRCVCLHRFACL